MVGRAGGEEVCVGAARKFLGSVIGTHSGRESRE